MNLDDCRERDEPIGSARPGRGWPVWAKGLASFALAVHLVAVLAGAFASPPASELEVGLFRGFLPYCQAIDQGFSYRYYAPNPSPTPVIFAEISREGGEKETVRIPEMPGISPRLLHQRHINLAHALMLDHHAAREAGATSFLARSMARYLLKERGGDSVTFFLRQHMVPPREAVARAREQGRPIDFEDGAFYTAPERLATFGRGEVGL